jgi:phage terminase small subunit
MSVEQVVSLAIQASEGEFGPAMQALNDRQRAFVIALLEQPNITHKAAAQMAGYAPGKGQQQAFQGYKLYHDERIQAAIKEEAERRLHSSTALAVSTVVGLMTSNDEKIRLKAASMILNRTGLHETTEHKVTTKNVSQTDEAMVERLKELAKQLGLPEAHLLKEAGVVDIAYTEVLPALPAPTPAEDADDLFTVTEEDLK